MNPQASAERVLPPSPGQVLIATRALLLLHPSSYSAWNARKQARSERQQQWHQRDDARERHEDTDGGGEGEVFNAAVVDHEQRQKAHDRR